MSQISPSKRFLQAEDRVDQNSKLTMCRWISEYSQNSTEILDKMSPDQNIEAAASQLLSAKGLKLVSCKTIQSLWAGYGHICQLKAIPSGVSEKPLKQETVSLILKYISPPATNPNRPPKEGHLRKILSYQIEQYFYTHLAPQMPKDITVAQCLSSIEAKSGSNVTTAMILTDLRQSFPMPGEKQSQLSTKQVHATISWLASFHGFWWNKVKYLDRSRLCLPPLEHFEQTKETTAQQGVWLNGGYTYLATRRDEYRDLCSSDSEWFTALCSPLAHLEGQSTIAELVAKVLAPIAADNDIVGPISEYETLIHGDVKSENLFTTTDGHAVAFFDFQYVGLGLGVCDLAKLFTCSVPEKALSAGGTSTEMKMGSGEKLLLQHYLDKIWQVYGKQYQWDVFVRHWETALVDWLRFQASWGFWGNTEWLEGRVRSILKDDGWKKWLEGK